MVCACLVRQGTKYPPIYTEVLKKQLNAQGMSVIVLGDGDDADIELRHGYEGWWAKLELFSPEMKPFRPLVFIDLDSLVMGPIPDFPDKFLMCREWIPHCHDNISPCQSSMMYIPKEVDYIWEAIDANTTKTRGGDQAWLCQFSEGFIQDLYPDLIGSYRMTDKEKPVHKIVTFHGKPKPPDAEGWAKDVWTAYST